MIYLIMFAACLLRRTILCANFQLQTFFPQNERLLDDQEIEAPRVDNSPSSHAQDTGKKKNKGGKHRQDPKAERGRYSAKSIEYGTVAGLAINVSRLPNLLPVCGSVA
jgi:hypothetical protein